MPYQDIHESIIKSSFSMPIAFATWIFSGENVFMSDMMREIIEAPENIMDSYEFVVCMRRMFGNFLKIAVDKVNDMVFEYKTDITARFGKKYNATLKYDPKNNVYILFFISISQNNSSTIQENPENIEYKQLLTILDTIPIYIWKRDKDLRITYCNKRYADAIESTTQKVIEENLSLFDDSSYNSDKKAHLEKTALISGRSQKGKEYTVINGNRHLLEVIEYPYNGRNIAFGCAIDITEKEELEKSLKNHKKQTDDTLNHISVPIIIFDENKRVTFANTSFLKMFDIDEKYISNNPHCLDIIEHLRDNGKLLEIENYNDIKDKILEMFTSIISPYHIFLHLPNGNALNVIVSPNYGGGLIVVFEDVSDKIKLERDYNSSIAVQKETLDHLYEGILVFGPDNRLKITNPAINNIWNKTDYEREIGTHITDFFNSSVYLFKNDDECESWISEIISMASNRIESSGTLILSSNKHIDYCYVPLPDGLNLLRFVDSTDKANLKNALLEKTEIMSQIDKLKSSLISNVSYDLKSPLNTIIGFSDILKNQYFGELNNRQLEYCNGIVEAVNRLSEIIDAMISLSSIEAGQITIKYHEINIKNFIDDTIKYFNTHNNIDNIEIINEISDDKLNACIDENSIRQVILQIISKYVKLLNDNNKTIIKISSNISESFSDYIEFSIHNINLGLSHEELEYTKKMLLNDIDEKSMTNSMDFGMILANSIIRLHNGKMFIESDEKLGTNIRFCVPMKQFMR